MSANTIETLKCAYLARVEADRAYSADRTAHAAFRAARKLATPTTLEAFVAWLSTRETDLECA